MFKELFIDVFLFATITQAVTRIQCRYDNECSPDECCYYHEGPLIVSKRQIFTTMMAPITLPLIEFQGGWCEKYLPQGHHCDPFDKLNGHCSCGPTLKCKHFPITTENPTTVNPTLSSIFKRSLQPGDYRCERI